MCVGSLSSLQSIGTDALILANRRIFPSEMEGFAMDLKGRGVLVTGGSKGLGRALVEALASKGARVVAVARGREALDEVVASVRAKGNEAHAIVADVADKEAI